MKWFTISELCRSEKATKLKIDNTPTPGIEQNLERLVANILDPLREAWGVPIDVTSGYRCPVLNKAVGGVKNSQHLTGQAADIRIYSRDASGKYIRDKKGNKIVDRAANRRLFQLIQSMGLPFDQLIDESNFSWVHVSFDTSRNRREVKKL
ncbi:MAG: peptidase M15 [Duncaniella sp.]|nr:peptidase M15 [Duncaniella sp.]